MERARQAFEGIRKSAEGVVDVARHELQQRLESLRAYAESDEFERDLDRLAHRLKLDTSEYGRLAKDEKAKYLFAHARKQILRSAETGGAFALFSRRSQVVMAISLICGGIKGAEIVFEAYHVFGPAVRRRGLHVV
ncbi:MAG: hypothetical protein ACJ763_02050 [Bdellovibrionia bacterium]